MEKFMKGFFVALVVIVELCAYSLTIVSVSRAEWISLFFLAIAIGFTYGIVAAIREYKK